MDVVDVGLAIQGKDRTGLLTMTTMHKDMHSNDSIHGVEHKRTLSSHG